VSHDICAVCCGTKRLVEIRCPEDCGYLQASRAHPAAIEQRQHQQDLAVIVPTIRDLTESQQQLFFLLLGIVRNQAADPLRPLIDEDVAEAAAALAATYETSARGVIYEHRPPTLPAQRLLDEFRAVLEQVSRKAGERVIEREASWALRAIERGARDAGRALGGPGRTVYLDMVGRVLGPAGPGQPAGGVAAADADSPSGLILPGQ
jgi:hypothetical protein